MLVDYITLFVKLASDVDLDPYSTSYCIRRLKSEGVQFLTATLPKLSKAVLRSLELGYFDRSSLTCFAWKGKSLRYFTKFLYKIFDRNGFVLDVPDPLAIYCLRQLCEYFYKLALPFDEETVQHATEKFVEIDNSLDLSKADRDFVEILRKDFENNFPALTKDQEDTVFNSFPPRPGSGTYSGRPKEWFLRKYTDGEYHPSVEHISGAFRGVRFQRLRSNSQDPDFSEVLFVPKDSRGPRTIVREPFLRLKSQLSFFDYIVSRLQSTTNGRIMFHDQSQNRELARTSSLDRKMCTIDLEAASDRVCFGLVLNIFRNSPPIRAFLLKHRTSVTKLPDGSLHYLKKVAGMGSGLTFPLMSLLIYLVAVRSVSNHLRISWRRASKLCYTYGDDLIAPSSCFHVISSNLQKCLLVVNSEKSYHTSHFRESCGGDYFNGQDVTPVRLKLSSANPVATKNGSLAVHGSFGLLTLERHCRELVKAGLYSCSEYLYSIIERSYGPLPLVCGETPVLGRYQIISDKVYDTLGVDSAGTHLLEKVMVPVSRKYLDNQYDPVSRLGLSLRSTPVLSSDAFVESTSIGFSDPWVSIPRAIAVKRVKASCFSRTGLPV